MIQDITQRSFSTTKIPTSSLLSWCNYALVDWGIMMRTLILNGNLKRVCFGFVILHPDFKMEGEGSICPKIFTMHFWVYLSCRVYCQRKVNIPLCCLLHLSQSKERLVSWIVLNKVRQRTKLMANGEMDLMLSILFCDGRYEDLAYGVWQALRSL